MAMSREETKALSHIRNQGDDRNLRDRKWIEIKYRLARMGLIKRRITDWAWVPVTTQ